MGKMGIHALGDNGLSNSLECSQRYLTPLVKEPYRSFPGNDASSSANTDVSQVDLPPLYLTTSRQKTKLTSQQ